MTLKALQNLYWLYDLYDSDLQYCFFFFYVGGYALGML